MIQKATPKRLLIAGGRDIEPLGNVFSSAAHILFYETGPDFDVVVGDARGVDTEGALWARRNSHSVETYFADWDSLGKSAGPERNKRMVDSGVDAAIIVWDGESKGTAHTLSLLEANKTPRVVIVWPT